MSDTHITVCTTCRASGTSREARAEGLALLDAVQEALWAAQTEDSEHNAVLKVQLRTQACMSGCNRACTLAIQGTGKWTYYWGDLVPDAQTAEQVVACALMHQRSQDGELPWQARPERLKSGVLARIPGLANVTAAQPV